MEELTSNTRLVPLLSSHTRPTGGLEEKDDATDATASHYVVFSIPTEPHSAKLIVLIDCAWKMCILRLMVLCLLMLLFVFAKPNPKLRYFDVWNDRDDATHSNIDDNSMIAGDNNTHRLPRVLNFFPVPVEEECQANDGRRKGVCMNTYECRIQGGKSHGFCALGFGVCCVFTATCSQEAFNNITYFVNPDFPSLSKDMSQCSLTVKKIDPEIAQLRLDFIHFNLGQPNRRTGVCEEDIFLMTTRDNERELKLCGLNSGQHAYFDLDLVGDELVTITMNLSRKAVYRLWEVKVTQVPFTQRVPSGCLQYYTGIKGFVQTMNFADNGRHLAEQDYSICMRQEEGMCSIAYEPCHENAFKIGPNNHSPSAEDEAVDSGSGDGAFEGRNMEICSDRIVMPCDSEDLIMPDNDGLLPGFCDLIHCGPSLCPSGKMPCRIESSVIPFTIGVHFGPSAREESPEDNLGMCLTYEQLPCNV